jgi:nucleoside-diphosphate-sugar epimerase
MAPYRGHVRIFLTGGSGFVGGHLIRRLTSDGHVVIALARSRATTDRVAALGAEPFAGDLFADLAPAMDDTEAVVHAAAWVGSGSDAEAASRVNVDGTASVLRHASGAGVRRFVHISTESVLLDGRALDGVDESTPMPESGHLSVYAATKAQAELLVRSAEGIETIALRPRLAWGPDDGTWLPGLVEKVDRGVFRWVDGGRHLGSTCHVSNLAEAVSLALTQGKPGAAYFVTDGDPITFREFATAYLGAVGVDPGDREASSAVLGSVAGALEFIWKLLPGEPPLNRVEVNMVGHPMVVDDSLARDELGYRPVVSIEDGMAALGA